MEEIEWNFNALTGEIFPEHITRNLELLYHGTSEVYSDDIEQNVSEQITHHSQLKIYEKLLVY